MPSKKISKKTVKTGKSSKSKLKAAHSKAGKGSKKMARKDYDQDGKLETSEQEYKGSKDKVIKKAKSLKKKAKSLKESFDGMVRNILKRIFIS